MKPGLKQNVPCIMAQNCKKSNSKIGWYKSEFWKYETHICYGLKVFDYYIKMTGNALRNQKQF